LYANDVEISYKRFATVQKEKKKELMYGRNITLNRDNFYQLQPHLLVLKWIYFLEKDESLAHKFYFVFIRI
jgi:hypothetical protein